MMRVLISFAAFLLIVVYIFISCKKDDKYPAGPTPQPILPSNNKAPIARAGADTMILLPACGSRTNLTLDGSGSSDPDNNIVTYTWSIISVATGFNIRNAGSVKPIVENLPMGEHAIQLSVRDAGNLESKDTILITIKTPVPKEYDFDITTNGSHEYLDNSYDAYNCWYYGICDHKDRTNIRTSGSFLPLGEFAIFFWEEADSAATSFASNSNIHIYQNLPIGIYVAGISSVNLKKLYQQGGGAFNGTITVTDGTARQCDTAVFKNRAPLIITGSIDTTAHKAVVKITGKTFF